jgi:DNA-binding CsgD family transcriptional regulator/DNA-binding response OmpR family regulator
LTKRLSPPANANKQEAEEEINITMQNQLKREIEAEKSTTGSRALANEAGLFCQSFRLTPRESEIVAVLAEGVTRIKDIADRLKLSPNTVNNHVNSIFMKTKARSKSQLLAMLLNRLSEELQAARYFRQSPRVVILSRNPELTSSLAPSLEAAGFQVESMAEMGAFKPNATFGAHFAVADLTMPDLDATHFCAQQGLRVVYIGRSELVSSRCEAMNLGAIDFFDATIEPSRIVNILLTHFIESDTDRARFVAAPAQLKSARAPVELSTRVLGRGGVFLSTQDVARVFGEPLRVGDRLDLQLAARDSEIAKTLKAQGEVVWVRSEQNSKNPGTGVRLLHLSGSSREDSQFWKDFVERHASQSYIPTGDSTKDTTKDATRDTTRETTTV